MAGTMTKKINDINVYIGGPIDNAEYEEAKKWREELRELLLSSNNNICIFDPFFGFRLNKPTKHLVEIVSAVNREVIRQSDVCIFYLKGKARFQAFGTIREIEYASIYSKKIIIISDDENLCKHVESHDLIIVEEIDDSLYEKL